MQQKKLRADSKIAGLRVQLTLTNFCLYRFKHNEAHNETYKMFNIFYTFLQ